MVRASLVTVSVLRTSRTLIFLASPPSLQRELALPHYHNAGIRKNVAKRRSVPAEFPGGPLARLEPGGIGIQDTCRSERLAEYHGRLKHRKGLADFMAAQIIADPKYVEQLRSANDWWTLELIW
jgi:hypothetical protein